ncbi:MAG: class I tRNA ligase family protein, partial [Pseudomonadota bacterium]
MWSVVEKTALAEAEVEYHEHQSHMIWAKFPVLADRAAPAVMAGDTVGRADPPGDLDGASVVIWTTTPWTIPQNKAVCFNPDLSYGLYEVEEAAEDNWAKTGDRYLLADRLAAEVLEKSRVVRYAHLRKVSTDELATLACAHPLRGVEDGAGEWDYDVPMLPGDHVTDDAGTGFVHTAPSHGADDYAVGVAHDLPMTYNVLEDGSFRPDLPLFGGAVIFDRKGKEKDANTRVIDALARAGALIARGRLKHSYPHSWRSKAPLIFRNTPQWFVAIDKPLDDGMGDHGATIRERALTSIDELVKFTPRAGRNRLHAMIETRPDWVLSRQRAWGVPLTCFMRETGPGEVELLRNAEVNARIEAAFRAEGADAWYEDGAKDRFLGGIEGVTPDDWTKVDDILDVWFDSGSTHAFTLRDREDGVWPADLYLEGTDQHRGWFHSSLLQGAGTRGRAPYKGVLTHGFTMDENGLKMSKSLGNGIDPADVIKQYGADILRLWVATTDFTADQRIGPEILKGVADGYRRLRNTMRFILGNLGDFSEEERVAPQDMPDLERWVLHRLAELDREVRQGYAAYDFQAVWSTLFQFCTVGLSAVYFDIRRDALYCDAPESLRRRACRTVLDALFHRLTAWLAPILVFTMEEVWLQRVPGEDSSIHLRDFPDTPADWIAEEIHGRWAQAAAVRRVVTGALEIERREKRIGSSLEAAPVVHIEDAALRARIDADSFADICIASAITLSAEPAPEGAFRLDDVPGVAVVPALAQGTKCARCWKVLPDVGTHQNPGVCGRCDKVLIAL